MEITSSSDEQSIIRVQYMFIEIHTIIQRLYTYYIIYNEKLDSNNKVSVHICCHAPKMANNKEEAVQLIKFYQFWIDPILDILCSK